MTLRNVVYAPGPAELHPANSKPCHVPFALSPHVVQNLSVADSNFKVLMATGVVRNNTSHTESR